MSMSVQIKKKRKPSQALLELLEGLAPDFQKLQDKVDEVFLKGREEGFNDMQIGDLVRSRMKEHYHSATIRRVLPDTAKHLEQSRESARKMRTNEREDDDEDTTIWQFNAEEFSIQNLEQYDKAYLRTAVEHFYAESRKWKAKYEASLKPKIRSKKKVEGTAEDKARLLGDVMQFRQGLIDQERRRSSDE